MRCSGDHVYQVKQPPLLISARDDIDLRVAHRNLVRHHPDRTKCVGLTESQPPKVGILPITLRPLRDVIEPASGIGQPVEQRDLCVVRTLNCLADRVEVNVSAQ